jgi:hypothetical protein
LHDSLNRFIACLECARAHRSVRNQNLRHKFVNRGYERPRRSWR